ncbi:MAG: response regulator [Pararhodobacter sp.]|nr:response regulator [Pararhodobacter sp.]
MPPRSAGATTEPADRISHRSPRDTLRVVIVEDEAIISMELEMLLEDLNADVVGTAMTAAEAEALVAAHRPDCITMDINIRGDRDGVDAARDIFRKYGVRPIFVTAYGDAETRKRAMPAHPIGWIRKPIEKEELDEMLRRVKRRGR